LKLPIGREQRGKTLLLYQADARSVGRSEENGKCGSRVGLCWTTGWKRTGRPSKKRR